MVGWIVVPTKSRGGIFVQTSTICSIEDRFRDGIPFGCYVRTVDGQAIESDALADDVFHIIRECEVD